MLKKHFLLLMLNTGGLLNIFVENVSIFQDSLMNRKLKQQHLFYIEITCNIRNAFTVTFDQLNASFLNKRLTFFT